MTSDDSQLSSFQTVGRDMYLTGLVSSHTGTVSIAADDGLKISRRDAMLGHLEPADFLELPLDGERPEEAPDDLLIHRAIYRLTGARSVIHARPPATMALSLIEDRLGPANGEGADAFGTVPVAISQRPLNSTEVADLMGQMLKDTRVAVLRGRGVFAWGDDLNSALHMVSLLEEMCRVAQLFRAMAREEEQPHIPERPERGPGLSPYRNPRGGDRGNMQSSVRHGGGNVRRPPRRDGGGHRRPGGDARGGSSGSFRP